MSEAVCKVQGYLTLAHRPSCANCWARKTEDRTCSLGEFDTDWAGWCPQWIPVARWIEDHPEAAKGMGLSRTALPSVEGAAA